MKNNNLVRKVLIILLTLMHILFIKTIVVNVWWKSNKVMDIFDSSNYIGYTIIEIGNIIFTILILKNKQNKKNILLYIVYLISIFFIPIFTFRYSFVPPPSNHPELDCLALTTPNYINIYGIDITEIVERFD